jgi:hypothetical protein
MSISFDSDEILLEVSALKARAVGLGSWHRGREPGRRSEISGAWPPAHFTRCEEPS